MNGGVLPCREHTDFPVGGAGGLTVSELDYLVRLREGGTPFFAERRAGGAWTCRFGGYVGAIALPSGRTLEVLPKTAGDKPQAARAAVMRMLAATGMAPSVEGDLGQYAACPHLIEAYLRVAAQLAYDAMRFGLVRSYRREHLRAPAIRGRWRIGAQLARLPERVDAHLLNADVFTADTIVNQALKAGILWVERLTASQPTLALCRSVLARMDTVRALPLSRPTVAAALAGLTLDRRHAHLERPLAALRLVVRGDGSAIASGDGAPGPAWLFSSERLFEAYIAQRMRRVVPEFRIVAQGPSRPFDTAGRFLLVPDMTAQVDGRPLVVFDTKWKQAEEAQHISQHDIRQIYAYARVYRTASAVLLYPALEGKAGKLADITVQDDAKTRLAAWRVPLPETTAADGDGTLRALLADVSHYASL
ncbi:MAG: McrC family protein [Acetobacteraceae bacterium]|nr:McrC family protein [Acetobacteraceae bacterium]